MRQVVEQLTEMTFKVKVEIPWRMPHAFMQEFAEELEEGLHAKARELAESWDGKAEVTHENV